MSWICAEEMICNKQNNSNDQDQGNLSEGALQRGLKHSPVPHGSAAVLLWAGDHAAHVDAVLHENGFSTLYGGPGQSAVAAQYPSKVHMEDPENVRARVHHSRVDIIRGENPVRSVGENYSTTPTHTHTQLLRIWQPPSLSCLELIFVVVESLQRF